MVEHPVCNCKLTVWVSLTLGIHRIPPPPNTPQLKTERRVLVVYVLTIHWSELTYSVRDGYRVKQKLMFAEKRLPTKRNGRVLMVVVVGYREMVVEMKDIYYAFDRRRAAGGR